MRYISPKLSRIAATGIAAIIAFTSIMGSAQAFPNRTGNPMVIRADRGGEVINYAIKARELEQTGRKVRFSGSCDSACTIYLSLPRSQTCVTPGATFGFHLPYGSSARNNKVAANYLMRQYPGWVRSWINVRGGLTGGMKRMDYTYAAKHLPSCETASKPVFAQRVNSTTNAFAFSLKSVRMAWR
jgi:hypothetical protein